MYNQGLHGSAVTTDRSGRTKRLQTRTAAAVRGGCNSRRFELCDAPGKKEFDERCYRSESPVLLALGRALPWSDFSVVGDHV
jgi:hypothetical protein